MSDTIVIIKKHWSGSVLF